MKGMNYSEARFFVEAFDQGKLGTPKNPNRGSTSYDTFWKVYKGFRKPSEYRNTMVYAAAVAGQLVRDRNGE